MVATLVLAALTLVIATAQSANLPRVVGPSTSLPQDSNLGIFDGKPANIKDFPYLVGLLVSGKYFCVANIVNKQWVLTSGDCVYETEPSDLTVVAASNDGSTGKKFQIQTIVKHPKYEINTFDYNYACLRTKGSFEWSDKVKAVTLPKNNPKVKTQLNVAGWGETSPSAEEEENGKLLQGVMMWQSRKVCKATYGGVVPLTARMACAYNKGKTTLCTGDWATGFVVKNVIYGLFSAGLSDNFCTSQASPILVADIYPVVAWIKKTTGAKYEE